VTHMTLVRHCDLPSINAACHNDFEGNTPMHVISEA